MARWLIWSLFVVAWSVALEWPFPPPREAPVNMGLIWTNKVIITKTAHVLAYVVLTILSAWVPTKARYRWLMMFFLMGHAWGSEMLQEVLYEYCYRTGELYDVGFDVIGIIIGAALSWRWWTRD